MIPIITADQRLAERRGIKNNGAYFMKVLANNA